MKSERITLEAIAALEREGLGAAINATAALYDSEDGLGRHGVQDWVTLTRQELTGKALGHLAQDMRGKLRDDNSGAPTIVHFCSRALQITARELRGLGR